jgi:hypothetical protein
MENNEILMKMVNDDLARQQYFAVYSENPPIVLIRRIVSTMKGKKGFPEKF